MSEGSARRADLRHGGTDCQLRRRQVFGRRSAPNYPESFVDGLDFALQDKQNLNAPKSGPRDLDYGGALPQSREEQVV
jgi:hypothetical protein